MPTDTLSQYIRAAEHNAIERDINRYLASGKPIIVIPRGQSGTPDGLYGAMGHNIRSRAKQKKLYDDIPESDDTEEMT